MREPTHWNETFDVVVVGYGFAGASAAIAAHDAGANVLLLEKMPQPGGISICSAGGVRVANDVELAFQYLKRTNADTAPDDVLRALAVGMTEVPAMLETLTRACEATVSYRHAPAIYPFPGRDTFGFCTVDLIPDFDPKTAYPSVRALGAGALAFRVLQCNVEQRGIEVRTSSRATRLFTEGSGRVIGLRIERGGDARNVSVTGGVVLACGGFEADPAMQRQYWQAQPVVSCAFRGNTGDGIRMAQAVGADLWHMWHYHGTYGFRVDGYPLGVRTKRLPDWYPSAQGDAEFDSFFDDGRAVKMPWILLDRDGRRFMNEYEPYMQDTGHRGLDRYRPETQDFPTIPCWLISDEVGRGLFPWGQPLYNDAELSLQWSQDNQAEVQRGVIRKADTLESLAHAIGVDASELNETVQQWNRACELESDDVYRRPPSSMLRLSEPPYYYAEIWPVVSNTQGGPVHDPAQRVLDPYGEPIPGLYAAGELGSAFGHLYLSGGNVSECFIGGAIAGRHAAGEGH